MAEQTKTIKIIDLFAGMGGIRLGFERAAAALGYKTECVLTSEIKDSALKVLAHNHPKETIKGDIHDIGSNSILDFDVLLGGFPCQAFSAAGKRDGFFDTRGTLFFEVERIIKEKKPKAFILENVEGLVNHDMPKEYKEAGKEMGRTLETILAHLNGLGYTVSWNLLNSKNFGLAQDRVRIYIVGHKEDKVKISLDGFEETHSTIGDVLEYGQPTEKNKFNNLLLKLYSPQELIGKAIKDKRGGETNIHSWDLEMKGKVSAKQKQLLNALMRERRKKHWAQEIGIDWMDGMPLTERQIYTFFPELNLKKMLDDLVEKKYLVLEHPKKLVRQIEGDRERTYRVPDETKPKGYNIVAGKLSFPISEILDPAGIAPTLVAMDMAKLAVVDNGGLRKLTLKEGLRLFGYPDNHIPSSVTISEGYDLLGNTVAVPVIQAVATRVINKIK